MKITHFIHLLLIVVLTIGFSSIVIAGGIEPGAGGEDCLCLETNGQPDVPITWPYLIGTFTISNHPDNSDSFPSFNIFISHIFLRKWNQVFLSPFYSTTFGATSICDLTNEQILEGIELTAAPCNLQVEEAFNLEGTPLVKRSIITQRSGCDTEDTIDDDIVRGWIKIGVVPTSLIYDEGGCVLP